MIERIIQLVLKNSLLLGVLAVLVMAAGYYSYRQLPVDAFPDVSPNLVQVFTVTEGLAPEEIETYVTYPIEISMNGLPGIDNIRSVSNFGLSVVNIYFEDGMDIYFARQLVGERLQEAVQVVHVSVLHFLTARLHVVHQVLLHGGLRPVEDGGLVHVVPGVEVQGAAHVARGIELVRPPAAGENIRAHDAGRQSMEDSPRLVDRRG